jgi:hypothetical protein
MFDKSGYDLSRAVFIIIAVCALAVAIGLIIWRIISGLRLHIAISAIANCVLACVQ